jgi:hypothetical protein
VPEPSITPEAPSSTDMGGFGGGYGGGNSNTPL